MFFCHRCQLPGELNNASYTLPINIMNMSYPFDYKLDHFSSCKMYDTNFTDAYYSSNIPTNHTINCHRWIYDKETFQNTAVMEVNSEVLNIFFYTRFMWSIFLNSSTWSVIELGTKAQRTLCSWSVSCWDR